MAKKKKIPAMILKEETPRGGWQSENFAQLKGIVDCHGDKSPRND